MAERAYTVDELDALRQAVETRWVFGTTYWNVRRGFRPGLRSRREDEMTAAVEQLVRTHMIAGHVAQDLYDADEQSAMKRKGT